MRRQHGTEKAEESARTVCVAAVGVDAAVVLACRSRSGEWAILREHCAVRFHGGKVGVVEALLYSIYVFSRDFPPFLHSRQSFVPDSFDTSQKREPGGPVGEIRATSENRLSHAFALSGVAE